MIYEIIAYPQDYNCEDPANDESVVRFLAEFDLIFKSYNRITVDKINLSHIKIYAEEHNVVVSVNEIKPILKFYNDI